MPYVVSTMSNDQNYTDWSRPAIGGKVAPIARVNRQILIKGKANVITKNLITPEGVLTKITDDELECLKTIEAFNYHLANGSLKIIQREAAPEKVARDMKDRDESAPLNEAKGDFKSGGRAAGVAPKSSKVE